MGAITNDEPTFARFIVDALSYPFRGDGFLILGLGTILFTGLNFLGQFSIYLTIAGWGYLLLMLQQVIPFAGHLIDELDALWSAVFVARVLGGLYLINRDRLGWF